MKNQKIIRTAIVVVLVGGVAVFFLMRKHPVDDQALKASLIGSWKAVDLNNAALHNHRDGVAHEDVVFKSDGTLVYRVVPKPGNGEPESDPYSWEIVKGKLQLRYTGTGSTQEALPRLKVRVDGSRLSIERRGFSTKVFERADS